MEPSSGTATRRTSTLEVKKVPAKRLASNDLPGTSGEPLDKVYRITEPESTDTSQGNVPLYNRFQCLATSLELHDEDSIIDCDNDAAPLHANTSQDFNQTADNSGNFISDTRRERRPPPIYLFTPIKNIVDFSRLLKEDVGDSFNMKFLGKQVKIQFDKQNDFIAFKQFAIAKNYQFHTYSLPEDKSITVTLKGLPNIPQLSIREELCNLGITINTCTQINSDTSLYAVYKINMSAKYTLIQLRKIRYLFHCRIYWDKFVNTKSIIQCYRCQAFGHTSSNCFKRPRCVKCAANHITAECTKDRDTPAKCCNCSGDHPANFSKCPSYLKFLEKRTHSTLDAGPNSRLHDTDNNFLNLHAKTFPTSFNPTPSSSQNPTLLLPSANGSNSHHLYSLPRSYADALKQTNKSSSQKIITDMMANNSHSNDLDDFNGLISEIRKLNHIIDVKNMFNIVRNLNIKLLTCNDGLGKLQAFIEAAELLN